ncbi:MAG: CocE/NonD family hydrolase [Nevskiaceae bacterium]|nr:MAG: CocE/NonD family hydrolase [Nevskiaceae bacterium]TBR74589.1 MAG: CocE/NonD family hydrolase [Nevskiaceae bacterium]
MNRRLLAACTALLLACGSARANPQTFEFKAPTQVDAPTTAIALRDLAERVLPVYEDKDPTRFLENLFIIQLVAQDDRAAIETQHSLKNRQSHGAPARPAVMAPAALFDAWVAAHDATTGKHGNFEAAFTQRLSVALRPLGDLRAFELTHSNGALPESRATDLQAAFDAVRTSSEITTPQALHLMRLYLRYRIHQQTRAAVAALALQEEHRRYTTEALRFKTRDGAVLRARLLQSRAKARRPVLLEFTLDRTARPAAECAAHGYACLVVYTRDAFIRRGRIRPFWYVPRDAAAAVEWAARQPWSDGRVGMYGTGYSAFAAWAAARHLPPALTAIATSNAMVPGIDFPTQGRIFENAALRWATNHTHGTAQHGEHREDFWQSLNARWYAKGSPYDTLDTLAGLPNGVFQRWLGHPSFDAHWQVLTPDTKAFAALDIPTLTVTGTFAANASGDLYLFRGHARHRPDTPKRNRATLLIGPWDGDALRDHPRPALGGLVLDPAARINLSALRFAWFDHIFNRTPRPALLKAAVNIEVAGTNHWQHAPSLAALDAGTSRFYLTPGAKNNLPADGQLTPDRGEADRSTTLKVDFKTRDDADWQPTGALVTHELPQRHAVAFRSVPLDHAMTLIGSTSGHLDFRVNKQDMDFTAALYAELPDGRYRLLVHPMQQRASYVKDRENRHLLRAGARQTLDFSSPYVAATALPTGSRLVFVLGISKRPDQQINYGTGDDVAVESIRNAGRPLEVRWYGGSYIDLPLRQAKPDPGADSSAISKPGAAISTGSQRSIH